jgi:hypothetical protein
MEKCNLNIALYLYIETDKATCCFLSLNVSFRILQSGRRATMIIFIPGFSSFSVVWVSPLLLPVFNYIGLTKVPFY